MTFCNLLCLLKLSNALSSSPRHMRVNKRAQLRMLKLSFGKLFTGEYYWHIIQRHYQQTEEKL
jgi:hypothetical protein